MKSLHNVSEKQARQLIEDEVFDLALYRRLAASNKDTGLEKILRELVAVETGHVAFWEVFFEIKDVHLSVGKKIKLFIISAVCRIGGASAIHITLEAIEIYGIKKYLKLWRLYQNHPLGEAIKNILEDELHHEDEIVSQMKGRSINPERIRSVFLGFNDGSVEILGAISGFFAAFGNTSSVLIASLTVAVAGAISMGAGTFAALSSESEISQVEEGRKLFLEGIPRAPFPHINPWSSALLVTISYFIGATAPIIPILVGATTALPSIIFDGIIIIFISMLLAFLSGMSVARRILLNLGIVCLAVSISYGIGLLTRGIFGISI